MSQTRWFNYLDLVLHIHKNKYEHPREQLIILVHWTFLSRNFKIEKDDGDGVRNGQFSKPLKWIKNENNTIDIDYFQEDLVVHIQLYFDNENFFIQFKTDENNQLHLKMPINDCINENDGSLKDVNEFIVNIGNEIYELIQRKKKIDQNKITTKN